MASKISVLINHVKDVDVDLSIFVIPNLEIAKQDWEGVKAYAESLLDS
ncbi:hypothetical protein LC087_09265 [Bacillus carboniphilus]|uniref:Uncharacterized protein n=1 Tax=Bacillus carboniphilus TaxID=86663 RepID=A0ABY9JSC7_9BACI|nr:hypothetical protein [Bacillus carboniphilus]WLR41163.1 hypothetical protein LC087_09265 [Bacillus carboniphilus]